MKQHRPSKILIIRLSAMGDVLLATPIIRALHIAFPESELHFLIKPQFAEVLATNPYLTRIHFLKDTQKETMRQFRREHFDAVIDLQKNLRSLLICMGLWQLPYSFTKANFVKWLMVHRKKKAVVPHIVTRYAEALAPLGVVLDEGGLDYPLTDDVRVWATEKLNAVFDLSGPYCLPQPIAVVLGATHFTKRWPKEKWLTLLNELLLPTVLLGGIAEMEVGAWLAARLKGQVFNATGQTTLEQSAALMKHCNVVITHDTGLMHLAAALGLKIMSIWGNTVPEFGMTPYRADYQVAEVKNLACRPCSKIGYSACPEGHFRCMLGIEEESVRQAIVKAGYLK